MNAMGIYQKLYILIGLSGQGVDCAKNAHSGGKRHRYGTNAKISQNRYTVLTNCPPSLRLLPKS